MLHVLLDCNIDSPIRVKCYFIVYLDLINSVSLVSNLIGKRSLCALLHVANLGI